MTGGRSKSNSEMDILANAFYGRFKGVTEEYFIRAFNLCLDQSDRFPTIKSVGENYRQIVASLPVQTPAVRQIEYVATKEEIEKILKPFRDKSKRIFGGMT